LFEGYDKYWHHWKKGWDEEEYNFGDWAHIELNELIEKMKQVSSNPAEAKKRGLAAAEWVREHETTILTAKRLVLAFESLSPKKEL
jgi:hypothetical protein